MALFRPRVAAVVTRATSRLSRAIGAGGGSTIGGRVGLFLEPDLLAELATERSIALVSGTNGKTTTTRLLARSLSSFGEIATSSAGANMSAGLVAALADRPHARVAALEVDEAYLGRACSALRPIVVVLLNLSRDQLDRNNEVRQLAEAWRESLRGIETTIVANADDPLVVYAAREQAHVTWVGTGSLWHDDAYHCPVCDARIAFSSVSGLTSWSCTCGFSRPVPDATVIGSQLAFADGRSFAIPQRLPGRFNAANAAMAAIAASSFGIEIGHALDQASAVEEVAGRFATKSFGTGSARLLLAKNPAGWAELLELVRDDVAPVVIGINARIADGHDPSWLWDVPFELLSGRSVIATGERRLDLAVRLRHAAIEHRVVGDQLQALRATGAAKVDYIGNYTAFQELRATLDTPRDLARATIVQQSEPGVPRHVPARDSTLRIVVVFPDLLGTYGDSGNGTVLANRASWRGHRAELVVALSDDVLPESGDIYLLGGGEDGPQVRAADQLRKGGLARAAERGATVLGVCAGFQILGQAFPATTGASSPGVGLLDVTTVRLSQPRAVGEVLARRNEDLFGTPVPVLTGFENHQSSTILGPDVLALARIERGIGNGDGRHEGAISGKVIGTYLHGPVLARNPALADALLGTVLGELEPLEDEEERALRSERLAVKNRSADGWHRLLPLLTRK